MCGVGCEPLADPESRAGEENTQPRGPQRRSLTDTQDYGAGLKGRHGDGEGSRLMVGLAPAGAGNVCIQQQLSSQDNPPPAPHAGSPVTWSPRVPLWVCPSACGAPPEKEPSSMALRPPPIRSNSQLHPHSLCILLLTLKT